MSKRRLVTQGGFQSIVVRYVDLIGIEGFTEVVACIRESINQRDKDVQLRKVHAHSSFSKTEIGMLKMNPATHEPQSLNKEVGGDGDGPELLEMIAAPSFSHDVDRDMSFSKIINRLTSSGMLSQQEVQVLWMRYGMEGSSEHTQESAGEKLGLTREQVKKLEDLALRKARSFFSKEGFDAEVLVD